MTTAGRRDRQERIRGWRQERLTRARLMICGAGALGNEVIKNLALAGAGRLLIVDHDRIETSNLSRMVLFRAADVGKPKAETAALAARAFHPDADIRWMHADFVLDVGLGFFRRMNLVVGGLDNLAARVHVGRSCRLAGVPFLDGAMWAMGGEARWFMPDAPPCFECILDDAQRRDLGRRRPCSGFRPPDPDGEPAALSTITTTAVVGGLMAQEAVRFLFGEKPPPGRALVYNGLTGTVHRTRLPRNPECRCAAPYAEVASLPMTAETAAPGDLLDLAGGPEAVLFLNRDMVRRFRCGACGREEVVMRPESAIAEAERTCPRCGAVRAAETVNQLGPEDPDIDLPLATWGVAPGDVLALADTGEVRLLELSGDVASLWNH